MPPAAQGQEQVELSEAVPANALRTSFLTAPQKNALREAFDNFWFDYGLQARHALANRAPSACCLRPPRRPACAQCAHARCVTASFVRRFGEAQAPCSECTRSLSSLSVGFAFGCARPRGCISCTTPAPSRLCSESSSRSRAYAAAAPAQWGTPPAITLTLPLARPSRGADMLSVRCFRHIARAQLSQPRLSVARRRAEAALYSASTQLPAASRRCSALLTSRCRPKFHAP